MKGFKKLMGLLLAGMLLTAHVPGVSYAAEVEYSKNVIPVMTSNVSSQGNAVAISFAQDGEEWRAFDKKSSSGWVSGSSNMGYVLGYNFTVPKTITKYALSRKDAVEIYTMPTDWRFEAWDATTNSWIVLDERKGVDWSTVSRREFVFENDRAYNNYRLNFTVYGSYIIVGELEMMETISEKQILKLVLEPQEVMQLSVSEDLEENEELIWTSSDESVATVDKEGKVTALNTGDTIIKVSNESGSYTEEIKIIVVDNAEEYRLAIDLKIGKKCRLTVDNNKNKAKVTWEAVDTNVATVSSKGKVKAVAEGLTAVVAKDEEGNIIGQVYIRVRE